MSKYSNEEIARAAGYTTPHEPRFMGLYQLGDVGLVDEHGTWVGWLPDWPNDPGACAEFLLPVLEARWPRVQFFRWADEDLMREFGQWCVTDRELASRDDCRWGDSFHACVIAAIMATAPEEARDGQ